MVSTSEFRNGLVMRLDGELYTIVEFQHVKPGKGGAFVRTRLKNVITGRVIDRTFRSGEKVDDVRLDMKPVQYLYAGDHEYVFMDSNSYDQNQALIRRATMALNPGGQIVVQDFIMDEDRTSPVFGALFSLNMLVATESGDTYTESEVRSWMEEAGLSGIHRKETGIGTARVPLKLLLNC